MLVPSPCYEDSFNTNRFFNSVFSNSDGLRLDHNDNKLASLLGFQLKRQTVVALLSAGVLQKDEIVFFVYRDMSDPFDEVRLLSPLGFCRSLR